MKELPLNFEIIVTSTGYGVSYKNGAYREATVMEVLLWNILWEIKTHE